MGPGNDRRMFQITAPVQPGNSGGPVLGGSGNVVGVLVAELALKLAQRTSRLPQNVNFAISGATVRAFLLCSQSAVIPRGEDQSHGESTGRDRPVAP